MPRRTTDRYAKAAADLVLRARNSVHWTQEELAGRLVAEVGGTAGTQRAKVADWERRKYVPSGDGLLAVLRVTQYSLDDFMEDTFGIRPRRRQGLTVPGVPAKTPKPVPLAKRVKRLEKLPG